MYVPSTGCVCTLYSSSFIGFGVALAFGDDAPDDSSILILSYVLASELKQLHLYTEGWIQNQTEICYLTGGLGEHPFQPQTFLIGLTWNTSVALGGILGGLPAVP